MATNSTNDPKINEAAPLPARTQTMLALTRPADGREPNQLQEGRCDIRGEAFDIVSAAVEGIEAERLFTPGLAGLPTTLSEIGSLMTAGDMTAFEQLVGRTRVGASGLEFFTSLVMRVANLETGKQPGEWFVPLKNGGFVTDIALRDFTRAELGGSGVSTPLVLMASNLAETLLNAYRPGMVRAVFSAGDGEKRAGAYALDRARYRLARPSDLVREYRRVWIAKQLTAAALAQGANANAEQAKEKNGVIAQHLKAWVEAVQRAAPSAGEGKKQEPVSPEILLRLIHHALTGLQAALKRPKNVRSNIILAVQIIFGHWTDALHPALAGDESVQKIITKVGACVNFRRWALAHYAQTGLGARAIEERDLEETAEFVNAIVDEAKAGGRLRLRYGTDLRRESHAIALRSVARPSEFSMLGAATPYAGPDEARRATAAVMSPTSEKEFVTGAPEPRVAAAVMDYRSHWLQLLGAPTASADLGSVDFARAGGTAIVIAGRPVELELVAFDGCEVQLVRPDNGGGWELRFELPAAFDYSAGKTGPLDWTILKRFCSPIVSDPKEGHFGRWRTPSSLMAGALLLLGPQPAERGGSPGTLGAGGKDGSSVSSSVDTDVVVAGPTMPEALLNGSTWLGVRRAIGRDVHDRFRMEVQLPRADDRDPDRTITVRLNVPRIIGDTEWTIAPHVFSNPAAEREMGMGWQVSRLVQSCEKYAGLHAGRHHVYLPRIANALIETGALQRAIPIVVRGTRRPFEPALPVDAVAAVLVAWKIFTQTSRALAVVPSGLMDDFQYPAEGALAVKLAIENPDVKAILSKHKGMRSVA